MTVGRASNRHDNVRRITPPNRGGGGSTPCVVQFYLTVFGGPVSGDIEFLLRWTNPDNPLDKSEYTVTISMPSTLTEIRDELANHPKLDSSTVKIDSPGAGMPGQEVSFWVDSDTVDGEDFTILNQDDSVLEGGWYPYLLVRKCCGSGGDGAL